MRFFFFSFYVLIVPNVTFVGIVQPKYDEIILHQLLCVSDIAFKCVFFFFFDICILFFMVCSEEFMGSSPAIVLILCTIGAVGIGPPHPG